MRNKFRAYLRSKHHQVSLQQLAEESAGADASELVGADEPGAHEQSVRRETAEIVREALDALPPHHRDVLALRYLERMSYKDIADALGCSLGTVKSRIHYALRSIALSLGDEQEVLP
jgi:RNA polymerase sigma-70 factor (ECF subfamily)